MALTPNPSGTYLPVTPGDVAHQGDHDEINPMLQAVLDATSGSLFQRVAGGILQALSPTAARDHIGAQPVDADLTAIAALSTTTYGRAFLALSDAAAGRAALSVLSEAQATANAQTIANAARAEAITTANTYTDEQVAAVVAAEGWVFADPLTWNAAATYPPRTIVDRNGGLYVSLVTTTGDDPEAGAPWRALPTAIDAAHRAALSAADPHGLTTYVDRLSLQPMPLRDVSVVDRGTRPDPLESFDGSLWGRTGSTLYRSDDDGQSWTAYTTGPTSPLAVLPCTDGEVLWASTKAVHRSTGWAGGSPTFAKVLDINGGAGSYLLRWGIDGDGTKFIATEYAGTGNWADSRYVWVSLDQGATWAVKWDTTVEFPATFADSHLHGVCYDPWEDRFWMIEGHGAPGGVRFSDDDGTSWTAILPDYIDLDTYTDNWQPTTMTACPGGIVCGSDSREVGLTTIRRAAPANLKLEWVWQENSIRGGLFAFADRGTLDSDTGIVYVGFRSNHNDVAPFVLASDGHSANKVWDYVPGAAQDRVRTVVTTPGYLHGVLELDTATTFRHLTARTERPGAQSHRDTGGIRGGKQSNESLRHGTAVGPGSKAGFRSVAVGISALAPDNQCVVIGVETSQSGGVNGTNQVVVGYAASGTSANATAVGQGASVSGASGTAVGQLSSAQSSGVAVGKNASAAGGGVAVGQDASTSVASAVAVGRSATALGVAVGHQANASQTTAVALGRSTSSTFGNSVAIGEGTATTTSDQVAVGPRSLLILNRAAAPATPAGGGVMYVEAGALKWRGSSGTITTLAVS